MALFTLEQLASYLKSDLDTATATLARSRATNYLASELGVEFTNEARTLTRRVPRFLTWQRLAGPITSVASVTVDGSALTVVDDYEVTEYGIHCPAGFGQDITTDADWCSLVVVHTGGYSTPPDELVEWGIYLGGLAYDGPQPGVRSSTTTVEGVSEAKTFTDGAAAFGLDAAVLKSLRSRYGSRSRMFGSVLLR